MKGYKVIIFNIVFIFINFKQLAQITYSYTALLKTYANDYVDKTEATLSVFCHENNFKVKYQDEESYELLFFKQDSVFGKYQKASTLVCGKGLKTDYDSKVAEKFMLKKKDIRIRYTNNRELISGIFCEEVEVNYVYRLLGTTISCKNSIWVSSDKNYKEHLNLNHFNEVWVPQEITDTLSKSGGLVFKQMIYFNDELVGKAEIQDFMKSDNLETQFNWIEKECKKPKKIKQYKSLVNQHRRAKDSFNRLSGEQH
jgi:hypothetical protein